MIGINFGRGVKKNPKTIFIYTPIKTKREKTISGQQNMNGKEEKVEVSIKNRLKELCDFS